MAGLTGRVEPSDCVDFAGPGGLSREGLIRLARSLRTTLAGEVPAPLMVAVLVPAACLSFTLGIALALANMPRGFDPNLCVLSRLCSSHHNPSGHGYLTFGMIALPAFLAPAPAWLARRLGGCPRLSAWGRATMSVGLAATAGVGIERAWWPTHWSAMESLHVVMAGVAFGGLWLGMAMLAGAAEAGHGPRVRWRWLIRPPWYLATSLLPILILFGTYLPVVMMPGVRSEVLTNWPKSLGFLRNVGFWQAYLVGGLILSLIAVTGRAGRAALTIAPADEARPARISLRLRRGDASLGARLYRDIRHPRVPAPRRKAHVAR